MTKNYNNNQCVSFFKKSPSKKNKNKKQVDAVKFSQGVNIYLEKIRRVVVMTEVKKKLKIFIAYYSILNN